MHATIDCTNLLLDLFLHRYFKSYARDKLIKHTKLIKHLEGVNGYECGKCKIKVRACKSARTFTAVNDLQQLTQLSALLLLPVS